MMINADIICLTVHPRYSQGYIGSESIAFTLQVGVVLPTYTTSDWLPAFTSLAQIRNLHVSQVTYLPGMEHNQCSIDIVDTGSIVKYKYWQHSEV